jgi:hypothetical protein
LQILAKIAKENWLFDEETDPEGKIKIGLEIILSGDVEDEEVIDAFSVENWPKGYDKWDALQDWAKALAG